MDDETRSAVDYVVNNGNFSHLENVVDQVLRLNGSLRRNSSLRNNAVNMEVILDAFFVAKLCLNQNIALGHDANSQLKRDSAQLGSCLAEVVEFIVDVINQKGVAGNASKALNFTRRLQEFEKFFDKKFEKITYPEDNNNHPSDGPQTEENHHDQSHQGYYNEPDENNYPTEHPGLDNNSSGEEHDYFADTSGLTITGGEYASVGGDVHYDDGSVIHPTRPTNAKRRTSFFRNLKNSTITDGNFMSIGGSMYGVRRPPSQSQSSGSRNGVSENLKRQVNASVPQQGPSAGYSNQNGHIFLSEKIVQTNTWGLQNQEADREYLPPYRGQHRDNYGADSEYTVSDRNRRFMVSSPEVSEPEPVDNAHHGPGQASFPANRSNGRISDQEEGSLSTNTNDGGMTLNSPLTSSMQTMYPEPQNEMSGQEQIPLPASSSSPPSIAHVVSSTLGPENNDASKKKKRKSLLKIPFKFIKHKNGEKKGSNSRDG